MSFRVIIAFLTVISFGCSRETPDIPEPRVVYSEPDKPIPPARPVPRPGFVNLDLLEDTQLFDLQTREATERLNTRYLIGCDRHNLGEDLNEFEQGVNLAINRISPERFLKRVQPIGQADCVYRIDIRDFGITRFEWEIIAANAILKFETQSVRGATLKFLTQAAQPYMFAADFSCVISECDNVVNVNGDIYYDLIDVPNNLDGFYRAQGVIVQREADQERLVQVGFSNSLISLSKDRLVQLVESDFGVCAQTFDTAQNGDQLFVNSFTKELINARGQLNSDKLFKHNASETICTGLNGLPIYFLSDANGVGVGFAPTNIVVNNRTPNRSPEINLGDCGNCHYPQVMLAVSDTLQSHILSNSAYDDKEKDLANTYIRIDKMNARMAEANLRNELALTELGVFALRDPVQNNVLNIRDQATADIVASYTLIPTTRFLTLLRGTEVSSQVFGNLLNGGTVNVATLKEGFPDLVRELNLFI